MQTYSFQFRYKNRKDDLLFLYIHTVTMITDDGTETTVTGDDIEKTVFPTNVDYVLRGDGSTVSASKDGLILIHATRS